VKYLFGPLTSLLEVTEDLTVEGSLDEGAKVASGCTLFVSGSLSGKLQIGESARVIVFGLFDAMAENNRGILFIAGALATPIEIVPGEVLVAAITSVAVADRTALVDNSGQLVSPLKLTTLSLMPSAWRWDREAGRFVAAPPGLVDGFLHLYP